MKFQDYFNSEILEWKLEALFAIRFRPKIPLFAI